MVRLGLYIVGGAPPEIVDSHGDYLAWFRRLARAGGAGLVAADGRIGETLDPRSVDGIVITGSPSSLTEPEPWMDGGVELIGRARDRGTPVLGVCFGHQLLGVALGARVIQNPEGWEFATQTIELDGDGPGDPLFAGVGPRLEVNQAHRDIIDPVTLPASTRVLARNPKGIQAIADGPHLRGIQFHPEFDGAIARHFIDVRRPALADDADTRAAPMDHPDRLQGRDTPAAEAVFHNFIEHFARGA